MRHAFAGVAIYDGTWNFQEIFFKPVAQAGELFPVLFHLSAAQFAGFAETNDTRDIEGAGKETFFVPTAFDQGSEPYPWISSYYIHCSDALRAVYCFGTEGIGRATCRDREG